MILGLHASIAALLTSELLCLVVDLATNGLFFYKLKAKINLTLFMYIHLKGIYELYMSLVMRKPAFCICENKYADQLCGNCEAYQRLCFRYTHSTIPQLPRSGISSF